MYIQRPQLSYLHMLDLSDHSQSIFCYGFEQRGRVICLGVYPPAFSCSPFRHVQAKPKNVQLPQSPVSSDMEVCFI